MNEPMSRNPHIGSLFDDFLKEEGLYEEAMAQALDRIRIWEKEKHCEQEKGLQKRRAGCDS
jgi:hypothetical protein